MGLGSIGNGGSLMNLFLPRVDSIEWQILEAIAEKPQFG